MKRKIESYEDLEVYQKLMQLHLVVHDITLTFPKFQLYELGSQLRRSSNSVKYPVKNFRWNESPAFVLNNIVAMTKPVRVMGKESGQSSVSVPALYVKEFHFSSVSDAV